MELCSESPRRRGNEESVNVAENSRHPNGARFDEQAGAALLPESGAPSSTNGSEGSVTGEEDPELVGPSDVSTVDEDLRSRSLSAHRAQSSRRSGDFFVGPASGVEE